MTLSLVLLFSAVSSPAIALSQNDESDHEFHSHETEEGMLYAYVPPCPTNSSHRGAWYSCNEGGNTHRIYCLECNTLIKPSAAHTWSADPANCTTPKQCSGCEYLVQRELGHDVYPGGGVMIALNERFHGSYCLRIECEYCPRNEDGLYNSEFGFIPEYPNGEHTYENNEPYLIETAINQITGERYHRYGALCDSCEYEETAVFICKNQSATNCNANCLIVFAGENN